MSEWGRAWTKISATEHEAVTYSGRTDTDEHLEEL